MTDHAEPPPKRPRQLTGKETLERIAQMTDEQWGPARLQLIAQEEARTAKMRAVMEGGKTDASDG